MKNQHLEKAYLLFYQICKAEVLFLQLHQIWMQNKQLEQQGQQDSTKMLMQMLGKVMGGAQGGLSMYQFNSRWDQLMKNPELMKLLLGGSGIPVK